MARKINTDIFKQEVYDLVGNEYTVLGEYKGNKVKILMRHNCDRCNNYEYEVTPGNFKYKSRCPKCANLNKFKYNTDIFKKEVYDLVGNEYTVLGEYENYDNKILMRHNCDKCNNYEYEVTPHSFLNNRRCPKCANLIKKTNDEFKQEVYDLVGNEYTVLGEYINTDNKILMRHNCDSCNNYEYEVRPSDFLKINGNRCPKCRNIINKNNYSKTIEEFKKEVYDLVGDEYSIISKEYTNNKTKIKIKHNCDKCNNYEYEVRPNDFQQGYRCPKCSLLSSSSKKEKEIRKFIESLSIDNINFNNRDILNGKELDIYLPDLKIAFEFDGLYWHSDIKKNKNYHIDKTNSCNLLGIKLIHIFEDEWINKQDIVKAKIKYLLNNTNNLEKIYARNCYVKEIKDSKIKNEFLNRNHIQGEDKSNINLGLYNKNKLVSVMTFCNPRLSLGQSTNTSYDGELSRFASDINYIVVGGFSKLWSYFEKNYEWNKIITYADKRWSSGNLYIKNGWNYSHDSKPNYWYCKNNNRFHRFNFRKQVLKEKFPDIYEDELTEFQIMDKTIYTRIWDCGNMVFEYNRK